MSKVLIISDTHGWDKNMEDVIEQEKPFDVLIHLGDVEGSEEHIYDLLDDGCQLYILKGNNDFFSDDLPMELETTIDGHHIFMTHGHRYGVGMGMEELVDQAKERGCDMVMFGHTHRPFLETIDGVTVINPGSLTYPRQKDRRPSYLVMETDGNGDCSYQWHYLDKEDYF